MTAQEHLDTAQDAFEMYWAESMTVAKLDTIPDQDYIDDLKFVSRQGFMAGWAGGLENGMTDAANTALEALRNVNLS